MNFICRLLIAATIAQFSGTAAISAADPPADGAAPEKPTPKITISKETTYITEPLRPDDYPDYFGALNKRMSEGVTPENNAAVLLVEATGPPDQARTSTNLSEERRANYFKTQRTDYYRLLGIEPLSERGDYYVSVGEMIHQQLGEDTRSDDVEKLRSQFGEAASRSWKATEFPIVAEWLRLNEAPLKLAMQATQRKKCFFPLVTSDKEGSLSTASFRAELDLLDTVAYCLCVRSQLENGQDNVKAAWDDILCCHRLAHLIDQGPFVRDNQLARKIEDRALRIAPVVAHFGRPSAEMARQMAADIEQLQPLSNPLDKCDIGQRFVMLDLAMAITRTKPQGLGQALVRGIVGPPFDIDLMLKMDNEWFDRYLAAAHLTDGKDRKAAWKSVDDEIKKIHEEHSLDDLQKKWLPKDVVSRRFAAEVAGLCMPTMDFYPWIQRREEMITRLTRTGLQLSVYRAETGHYPEKLDELVPKYMSSVPADIFANKPQPICYRREGDAYVLWSTGPWWTDEEKQNNDGEPHDENNEMVLRPVPKEEAKEK